MNILILRRILQDSHEEPIPSFQPRKVSIPLNVNKIITLVGPRRAGKTSELYNIMGALFKQGIPRERIFYLNCEDERFEHSSAELGQCLEVYQALYPALDLSTCYFFFDEIQLFDKWDRFIRRLHDKVSQHIFLTGSNAKLLSSEIATELRGRSLSYPVLPLSFSEYCYFQDIDVKNASSKNQAVIDHALEQYLQYGGFPELLQYDESLKVKILQEYFNAMFYRDLIERFEIKNVGLFKFFLKRLISSASKEFSVHKIYNELKSSGYKISKDSLYDFSNHCEAIYMFVYVKKYSSSIIHQELTDKKIFVIDNGLYNAINSKFSDDIGKLMEQAVLHALLRQPGEIYFHKQKYECDFLVKQGMDVTRAIQVSYTLIDPDVQKREIGGLLEACHENGLTEGIVVTFGEREVYTVEGVTIHVVPLCDFLVETGS